MRAYIARKALYTIMSIKQIRALIAEDEALPRDDLIAMLAKLWPELELCAIAANGTEALEMLAEHKPDIAFLDIRMPGPNGLEVARAASGQCHVVFTTAYDQYAVEAFQTQALDYLLKPVQHERLSETITRLKERIAAKPEVTPADLSQLVLQLTASSKPAQTLRFVSASVGDTVKLFAIEEVLYFQSDEKYTRVVTASDEAFIRKTLKELLAELNEEEFWQVHRGTLVRATAIERAVRDDMGRVILSLKTRPEKLPVSQAFAYRFRGM
jgi:DNA-binding LytR/AlgR family response regulator